MKRLMSALAIVLLTLGSVCAVLPGGGASADMSHAADGDSGMAMTGTPDDPGNAGGNCPTSDPGDCCGVAGGHCATSVPSGVTTGHPANLPVQAILPDNGTVPFPAHADIDIPPPRA